MADSCYLAYTATHPWGSAPRASDSISHIALSSMLYLLHTTYVCIIIVLDSQTEIDADIKGIKTAGICEGMT